MWPPRPLWGGTATSALTVSKCEIFYLFFHWNLILWHSKHILSHWEGSEKCIFHVIFVVVKMRGRPLANDDPKGPASCKWWSEGTGLLQMVIRRGRPFANDDPEGLDTCKWSFRGASLLQMIIWRVAAVRGEIGDFKIHELSFVFSGRSTRWARKASSSMSGHMLNPRSTMWRSPSLRSSAVYAQDLHWGNILPVFPVTQGRELSWEGEISSVFDSHFFLCDFL